MNKETFLQKIKADIKANFSLGNPKLLFNILFYRISSFLHKTNINC